MKKKLSCTSGISDSVKALVCNIVDKHLTCPICLDVVTDAHTNPECLHRFCGKCIRESLHKCNHECPTCRVHIPTHRTMRKDTAFEEIKDAMLKIIEVINENDGDEDDDEDNYEDDYDDTIQPTLDLPPNTIHEAIAVETRLIKEESTKEEPIDDTPSHYTHEESDEETMLGSESSFVEKDSTISTTDPPTNIVQESTAVEFRHVKEEENLNCDHTTDSTPTASLLAASHKESDDQSAVGSGSNTTEDKRNATNTTISHSHRDSERESSSSSPTTDIDVVVSGDMDLVSCLEEEEDVKEPPQSMTQSLREGQMKIPRKLKNMNNGILNNPPLIPLPQDSQTPAALVVDSIPPPPPPPPPSSLPPLPNAGSGVPIINSISDIQALQAELPEGIIIPEAFDPQILLSSKPVLRIFKELSTPVQMQAVLIAFTEAMKNKGDSVRNAQGYLVGVIKRYINNDSQRDSNARRIMGENITPVVKAMLIRMVASGFYTRDDLSDKVYAKIKMLSEHDAILAIEEISSVPREQIQDFTSYVIEILNKYMRFDDTTIPLVNNDRDKGSDDTERRSRDDFERSSCRRRRRSRSYDSKYDDRRYRRRRRGRRYRDNSDDDDSNSLYSRDYRRRRNRRRFSSRSRDRYEKRRDRDRHGRRSYRSRSRSISPSPNYRERDRDSRLSKRDESVHRRNDDVLPSTISTLPLPGMAVSQLSHPYQPNNQPGNLLMQQPPQDFPPPPLYDSCSTFQPPFTAQNQEAPYVSASVTQGLPNILGVTENAPPPPPPPPPTQQSQSFSINSYSNTLAQHQPIQMNNLSHSIQMKLIYLQAIGHLDTAGLAGTTCHLLNNLSEVKALEALDKFSSCDTTRMRSKESYLAGILRNYEY